MENSLLGVLAAANPEIEKSLRVLLARAQLPVQPELVYPKPPVLYGAAAPIARAESPPGVAGSPMSMPGAGSPPTAGSRTTWQRASLIAITFLLGAFPIAIVILFVLGFVVVVYNIVDNVTFHGRDAIKWIVLAVTFSIIVVSVSIALIVKLWRRVIAVIVNPMRSMPAPDPQSARPLNELEQLAGRSIVRLYSSYRIQLGLSIFVAVIIGAAFIWSLVMVAVRRLTYATAFGSGGIGATVMAIRWQPFDRVSRARDLAEQADALATGLRLRMATIAQIEDPLARHEAEWQAVKDYISEALRARRADDSERRSEKAAAVRQGRGRKRKS